MYKILTQIHLNYKFKKITFKNIQIHGLSDCLAKGVKILDGMKCSPLLAPIPLDTWKSEIQLSSGIIIMLFLLSYEVHIMLNTILVLLLIEIVQFNSSARKNSRKLNADIRKKTVSQFHRVINVHFSYKFFLFFFIRSGTEASLFWASLVLVLDILCSVLHRF